MRSLSNHAVRLAVILLLLSTSMELSINTFLFAVREASLSNLIIERSGARVNFNRLREEYPARRKGFFRSFVLIDFQ